LASRFEFNVGDWHWVPYVFQATAYARDVGPLWVGSTCSPLVTAVIDRRRRCQQHLTLLSLGLDLAAEPNVGLMALTALSQVIGERPQPLQSGHAETGSAGSSGGDSASAGAAPPSLC
jgi:hypothetical protein